MIIDLNNVQTWADGYGLWHASVPLDNGVSDYQRWRTAREAIVRAITEREQKTWETLEEARKRISATTSVSMTPERVTNHGTVIYRESAAERLDKHAEQIRGAINA